MVECTRIVNSWFSSNTYILSHSKYEDVWLIDPGDVLPVLEWLIRKGKKSVAGILLTHAHFDHMYGINDILKAFPQSIVYTSNDYGMELLFDAKKNASQYTEMGSIVIDKEATIRYYEQEQFLWPGIPIKVYRTPGHSDDSVCFIVENMLFTGDTLIKDVRTVTKLKTGSKEKLEESLREIEFLKGKGLLVHPGHEDIFSLDEYNIAISKVGLLT